MAPWWFDRSASWFVKLSHLMVCERFASACAQDIKVKLLAAAAMRDAIAFLHIPALQMLGQGHQILSWNPIICRMK